MPTPDLDTAQVGDQLGADWWESQTEALCDEPRRGGWWCSRERHATGQHVAVAGGTVYAVWPQETPPDSVVARAARVIGYHQPTPLLGACRCGWTAGPDTTSHAGHLAGQLAAAGLLTH